MRGRKSGTETNKKLKEFRKERKEFWNKMDLDSPDDKMVEGFVEFVKAIGVGLLVLAIFVWLLTIFME